MTAFEITIISDTVCPFCYLGRARLDRAIALYRKTVPGGSLPSTTFTIRWHAYRLGDATGPSVPVRDVAAARFGADRLAAKHARMAQLGTAEGFDFTFAGRIGPTRDSHRVVQLGARRQGPEGADRVMREVMRMFFEQGGDICSWADLATAAERAGVASRAEALRWLEDGRGGDEVDAEVEEAARMGVRGVPKFIINGKHEVDGAGDVSAMLEQLVAARDEASVGESAVAASASDALCETGACTL